MSAFPLFSILIANYNNGCYLSECIDSILAQSYENWEVVVVDDGSTDISSKVYEQYSDDPRFHIYFNDKNYGVGVTKKKCVDYANGDICGFVDPDDVLFGSDVIRTMVSAHIEFPNASLIYSGMYRADENLNIIRSTPGLSISSSSSALQSMKWPIHPFATFKKRLYDKTSGVDGSMKRSVDSDLYYKLEEVGDLVHIDCIQYIQRNNPHSISLNDNAYKAAAWHTYSCIQAMKRRGLTDEELMLFPMKCALRNEYNKGYNKATHSMTYKVGHIITYPLLLVWKIWKKWKK